MNDGITCSDFNILPHIYSVAKQGLRVIVVKLLNSQGLGHFTFKGHVTGSTILCLLYIRRYEFVILMVKMIDSPLLV